MINLHNASSDWSKKSRDMANKASCLPWYKYHILFGNIEIFISNVMKNRDQHTILYHKCNLNIYDLNL